jgi:hypothetical protein
VFSLFPLLQHFNLKIWKITQFALPLRQPERDNGSIPFNFEPNDKPVRVKMPDNCFAQHG